MSDTDTIAHEGHPKSVVAETANRPRARALETESRANPVAPAIERAAIPPQPLRDGAQPQTHRRRVLPFAITVAAVVVASVVTTMMWNTYMDAPWTRDGTVRAYVVTMAPEVSGRIVELPVADNQFVHRGDLLMTIDPTNYKIAVSLDEAAVDQAEANMQNTAKESQRRQLLTDLAVTTEENTDLRGQRDRFPCPV
jgi:multidrug resistance efflux pump